MSRIAMLAGTHSRVSPSRDGEVLSPAVQTGIGRGSGTDVPVSRSWPSGGFLNVTTVALAAALIALNLIVSSAWDTLGGHLLVPCISVVFWILTVVANWVASGCLNRLQPVARDIATTDAMAGALTRLPQDLETRYHAEHAKRLRLLGEAEPSRRSPDSQDKGKGKGKQPGHERDRKKKGNHGDGREKERDHGDGRERERDHEKGGAEKGGAEKGGAEKGGAEKGGPENGNSEKDQEQGPPHL
jgi:hypothetical protein